MKYDTYLSSEYFADLIMVIVHSIMGLIMSQGLLMVVIRAVTMWIWLLLLWGVPENHAIVYQFPGTVWMSVYFFIQICYGRCVSDKFIL